MNPLSIETKQALSKARQPEKLRIGAKVSASPYLHDIFTGHIVSANYEDGVYGVAERPGIVKHVTRSRIAIV